MKESVL
jgi:hypothetical protein